MIRADTSPAVFDYTEISPDLVVGSRPDAGADARLLRGQLAVTAVLSLQTDADLARRGEDWAAVAAHYRAAGLVADRLPITDFDAGDLRHRLPEAAERVERLVRTPHRLYLHCTLGLNRAPTVAIAWLAWHRAMPLARAWQQVTAARSCEPDFESLWVLTRDRQRGDRPTPP